MSEMWDTLVYYFQFPLVQRAMVVGLLIALCSSLLGVTLVLKRFSFIGDGLSHVAFGAMSAAIVASVLLKAKGSELGKGSFPMWLAKLLDETVVEEMKKFEEKQKQKKENDDENN